VLRDGFKLSKVRLKFPLVGFESQRVPSTINGSHLYEENLIIKLKEHINRFLFI
jgi:hypothetical protein